MLFKMIPISLLAQATTDSVMTNVPKVDLTITISIVITICALFAPSITAIVNNKHLYKIRKLELQHDAYMHHSDIQYKNKYAIYNAFLEAAGVYDPFKNPYLEPSKMLSLLQNVLLLCDSQTRPLILDFQDLMGHPRFGNYDGYANFLAQIAESFNRELSELSSIYNDQSK